MDDITIQNLAEEKYKELRTNSPMEKYSGDYKSPHYKEIPNAALVQTVTEKSKVYTTEYNTKFDEAAKDFWKEVDPKNVTKYQTGETVCNFNTESLTIDGYFSRIFQLIKEGVSVELAQHGQTSEDLKNAYNMLELSLKLVAEQIAKTKKNIDITSLMAFMHGFVNTYIKKNIKTKG